MASGIVLSTELGPEFEVTGSIQVGKIRLKLGDGLAIQPDGTIVTTAAIGTLTARLNIAAGTITNSASPLNRLSGISTDWDDIGLTVAADSIDLGTGTYEVDYKINTFDNNSARVMHRSILNRDGTEYSRLEGNNYMRDATAADSGHIRHEDLVKGGVLTLDLQTTSSVANTTTITNGYILIKKLS